MMKVRDLWIIVRSVWTSATAWERDVAKVIIAVGAFVNLAFFIGGLGYAGYEVVGYIVFLTYLFYLYFLSILNS